MAVKKNTFWMLTALIFSYMNYSCFEFILEIEGVKQMLSLLFSN